MILLPALGWWRLGLNSVMTFWTGLGFGNGQTAVVIAVAVFALWPT